jgi:hypothetical protein
MSKLYYTVAVLLLACGSTGPTPPTGAQCSTSRDIRETCWTCASEPACAWWASEDADIRGCRARTDSPPEAATVVRVSDDCNDLAPGTDR